MYQSEVSQETETYQLLEQKEVHIKIDKTLLTR